MRAFAAATSAPAAPTNQVVDRREVGGPAERLEAAAGQDRAFRDSLDVGFVAELREHHATDDPQRPGRVGPCDLDPIADADADVRQGVAPERDLVCGARQPPLEDDRLDATRERDVAVRADRATVDFDGVRAHGRGAGHGTVVDERGAHRAAGVVGIGRVG